MENMLHIYYGDGKGKTTAAEGLIMRAAGQGLKVLFCQFLKDGASGEVSVLKNIPNVEVVSGHDVEKFIFQMSPCELEGVKNTHNKRLDEIISKSRTADIIVLDEVIDAYTEDLINREKLLELLRQKPAEIVVTGHSLPNEMEDLADYISEIKCHRHPYSKGVAARKGIEY